MISPENASEREERPSAIGAIIWAVALPIWAAIMPICGGVDPANAERYRGMNISFFHGSNDDLVNVDYSRRMDKALTEKGIAHTYKEYPGVKHDSWTRTYADSKVLAWMFGCRK